MPKPSVIKSVDGNARLEISALPVSNPAHRYDYLDVTIISLCLRAKVRIYNFVYAQGKGGLTELFAELAANWKGWVGAKSWESVEGDFKLSCTCDSLGHVFVKVTLGSNFGSPSEWHVESGLILEAGQLDAIVQDVKLFFTDD